MFLTEDQANARLNNESNLANIFARKEAPVKESEVTPPQETISPIDAEEILSPKDVINRIMSNHTPGPRLTVEARTEIAFRARLGENQEKLAEEFGTIQENVSHIKNGRAKGIDEDSVSKSLAEVRDRALDRLMTTLGLITDDKLSGCSAKDLSVIASNMGRVVEKTLPKAEAPDRLTLIVYSPQVRSENSYASVDV